MKPVRTLYESLLWAFLTLSAASLGAADLTITTHDGNGADVRVVGVGSDREFLNNGGSSALELRGNDWSGASYTGYIRFDLSALTSSDTLSTAAFILTVKEDSDVTGDFEVYGLLDGYAGGADGVGEAELDEFWLEGSKDWTTAGEGEINGDRAPAFIEEGPGIEQTSAVLLGGFSVSAPTTGTEHGISGTALMDFLEDDTNGVVTIIIIGTYTGDSVRFMSKEGANDTTVPRLELGFGTGGGVSKDASISTADGQGADARVVGVGLDRELLNNGGATRLGVRGNSWAGGKYVGYLRFDLSTAIGVADTITAAVLNLTFSDDNATVMGNIGLYGLIDAYAGGDDGEGAPELDEFWLEGSKDWVNADPGELSGENAPAFNEGAGSFSEAAILLGTADISGGSAETVVQFSDPAILDFLNADTNGVVTLILEGQWEGDEVSFHAKEGDPDKAPVLNLSFEGGNGLGPVAPSDLTALEILDTEIVLGWTDNSDNELGFIIEVSEDGTTFTRIATVDPNTTSLAVSGLDSATEYLFQVIAYDGSGYSDAAASGPIMTNGMAGVWPRDSEFAGPDSAPAAGELYAAKPALTGTHPRILPAGLTVEDLRLRVTDINYNEFWSKIVFEANAIAAISVPHPNGFNPDAEDPYREYGRNLNWLAMAIMVETNPIREDPWLDALYAWLDYWEAAGLSNADLTTSHLIEGLACIYDWLHDELPTERLEQTRKLLISHVRWLRSPENPGAQMWQGTQFSANHNWYNHMAIGLAAMALSGEDASPLYADEPGIWLDSAMRNFHEVGLRLSTDGAANEGYHYMDYGSAGYFDFAIAADSLTELSDARPLLDCPAVQNFPKRINYLIPNEFGFISFGDGSQKTFSASWVFHMIASRFSDPLAQALGDLMLDNNFDGANWRNFLYFDSGIESIDTSTLPTHYDGTDMNIFTARTSWEDEDALFFAFKSGLSTGYTAALADPDDNTGHNLPDQGSIWLWAGDTPVIAAPGYERNKYSHHHPIASFEVDETVIEQAGGGGPWFSNWEYQHRMGNAQTLEVYHGSSHHQYLSETGGLYTIDNQTCEYRRLAVFFPEEKAILLADRIRTPKATDLAFRIPLVTNVLELAEGTFSFSTIAGSGTITDYSPGSPEASVSVETLDVWPGDISANRRVAQLTRTSVTEAIFAVVINLEGGRTIEIDHVDENGIFASIQDDNRVFGFNFDPVNSIEYKQSMESRFGPLTAEVNNWTGSHWFGYMFMQEPVGAEWIQSLPLGWIYSSGLSTPDDNYNYSTHENLGWTYTSQSLWPFFYSYKTSHWLFAYIDYPGWVVDYDTGDAFNIYE